MARPTKKQRIDRAIKDGKKVSFTYYDTTGSDKGKASHRTVSPVAHGTSKAVNGVVRAYDNRRNDWRLFREDGITKLKISKEKFKTPKGYKKGDKGMIHIRSQRTTKKR